LHIVIADPHRPGHEVTYHPGETNLRMAHVVVINKVDTARPQDVASVRASVARANPTAVIIEAASPVQVDDPSLIPGRRALVGGAEVTSLPSLRGTLCPSLRAPKGRSNLRPSARLLATPQICGANLRGPRQCCARND